MAPDVTRSVVDWLRARSDCVVEDGLDEAELTRAERTTSVRFPPLWRSVLAAAHPVAVADVAYPDWRLRDASAAKLVAAPSAGVLFDVEHNGFWWPSWGRRPDDPARALDVASAQLRAAPTLVPIRGHWYTGREDDTAVLSIVQTDVYLQARSVLALASSDPRPLVAAAVEIPFWSELHRWSADGAGTSG